MRFESSELKKFQRFYLTIGKIHILQSNFINISTVDAVRVLATASEYGRRGNPISFQQQSSMGCQEERMF